MTGADAAGAEAGVVAGGAGVLAAVWAGCVAVWVAGAVDWLVGLLVVVDPPRRETPLRCVRWTVRVEAEVPSPDVACPVLAPWWACPGNELAAVVPTIPAHTNESAVTVCLTRRSRRTAASRRRTARSGMCRVMTLSLRSSPKQRLRAS